MILNFSRENIIFCVTLIKIKIKTMSYNIWIHATHNAWCIKASLELIKQIKIRTFWIEQFNYIYPIIWTLFLVECIDNFDK